MENWRDVPGFQGYYEVSDQGRVRSVARIVKRGSGTQKVRERILRPGKTKAGYFIVALFRDGKQHMAYVHHLVLEAFVGPRPQGLEGKHENGVPHDCRLKNLTWGTTSQNERDKERHGTSNHGAASMQAKRTVYDILQGRTWGHVK